MGGGQLMIMMMNKMMMIMILMEQPGSAFTMEERSVEAETNIKEIYRRSRTLKSTTRIFSGIFMGIIQ